jgi:hypothetical protein
MRLTLKFAILVLALLLMPRTAQAYVDPGILSVLFQGLYVAVFGVAAAYILRPWTYLKSLFKKGKPDVTAAPERDMEKPK